jgi:hypothetical protein
MENQQQDEYIEVPYPQQYQGVPIPQRDSKSDFMEKIRPDPIVETIRHKLMGEELIDGKWVKIDYLKTFAISDRGAWEISNQMLSISSLNISISSLHDYQIRSRIKFLVREVMYLCLTNWREYNINDIGQLYYIKSMVIGNSIGVLHQALEGHTANLVKENVQEIRNINTERKEPGRLKRMLGMA